MREIIRRLFLRGKIVCVQHKGNYLFTKSLIYFRPYKIDKGDTYDYVWTPIAIWRLKKK